MNLDKCPEFLKPRLRLFLSADIVGSTALKQSPFSTTKNDQRAVWFSKIQGFYFEADQAFRREFKTFSESDSDPDTVGEHPELWKTIGDEVVFVKLITDHRQVIHTLRCWMRAISSIREFVKKDNSRLDVKCTAWLAGFPFRNSEVAVEIGDDAGDYGSGDGFIESGKILNRKYNGERNVSALIDYIGPSIDIGFRLSQFCSSRKFVISVDVAYILALANPGELVKDPVFSIYYDESHVLKGVLGGLRYPIFWLDVSPNHAIERFEDELTKIAPVNRDRLGEYCNQFYTEFKAYMFPPFIVSESEQVARVRPDWYDSDHAALVRSFVVATSDDEVIEGADTAENAAGNETVSAPNSDSKIDEFLTHLIDILQTPTSTQDENKS